MNEPARVNLARPELFPAGHPVYMALVRAARRQAEERAADKDAAQPRKGGRRGDSGAGARGGAAD